MKINYQGIKGKDGVYDLGRATLIQGDHDTGKSTLLAAIHFGLSGKIPALRLGTGETQAAGKLLKNVSDGGFSEVTLEDLGTVRRTLEATAKSARVLTECNGETGPAGEAMAAAMDVDMVFADFRRLLGAGDKERATLLAQYLPQPDDEDKRVWLFGNALTSMAHELVGGKKKDPWEASSFKDPDAIEPAETRLDELATANHAAEIVDRILEKALGRTKSGKATPDEIVETLRTAANDAQKKQQDAATTAKTTAEALTQNRALAAEIPALETQVNALRAQRDGQAKTEAEINRRNNRMAAIQARGKALKEQWAWIPKKEISISLASAEKSVSVAQAVLRELETRKPVSVVFNAALTAEQRAIAALETEIKTTGKAKLEQREAVRKGRCPILHSSCELLAGHDAPITQELEGLGKHLAETKAKLAAVEREIELSRKASERFAADMGQWYADHKEAELQVSKAETILATMKEWIKSLPELEKEMTALSRELKELQALAAEPSGDPDQDIGSALKETEAKLRDAHAAKARADVMAGMDIDALETEARLWKAAHRGAVGGLAACIQEAAAPIEAEVTESLHRFGFEGRFVVDLITMEIGIMIGNEFLSVDTLGGAKLIYFAVALLQAVPQRTGPRVLTLETAEMRPYALSRLLAGIDLDKFASVEVASCHDADVIPEGWNVIRMEKRP